MLRLGYVITIFSSDDCPRVWEVRMTNRKRANESILVFIGPAAINVLDARTADVKLSVAGALPVVALTHLTIYAACNISPAALPSVINFCDLCVLCGQKSVRKRR